MIRAGLIGGILFLLLGATRADICAANSTDIAGVWRLVEASTTYPDGRRETPFGDPPGGIFIYTPDGHLSLHLNVMPPLPRFEGRADDAAVGAVARRYIGYYGTWSINEERGEVIHHIEGAMNPNRIGQDAARPYRLCGEVLELSIKGDDGRIFYRRLERIEKLDAGP